MLATIETAGLVSNSATTATSSNVQNTIVLRDTSGFVNLPSVQLSGTLTFLNSTNAISIGMSPLELIFVLQNTPGINFSSNCNVAISPHASDNTKGSSLISVSPSGIQFWVGAIGQNPTELVTINSSGLQTLNGSVITSNVTGNVTGTSSGFTGELSGVVSGEQTSTTISNGNITNAMLATINTPGLVSNSATSATASNVDSTIVLRDLTNGIELPSLNINGTVNITEALTVPSLTIRRNTLTTFLTQTTACTFSGPFTSTPSSTLNFNRLGDVCTLTIAPVGDLAATASASLIICSVVVPVAFMPQQTTFITPCFLSVNLLNGPTPTLASLSITSSGQIQMCTLQPFALPSSTVPGSYIQSVSSSSGTIFGSIGWTSNICVTYLCNDINSEIKFDNSDDDFEEVM